MTWLVVDGRADHSAGMTLAEVADFLLARGAWRVYNLDGGGSTTLALRAGTAVVNTPSDGRERRRTDVVLVLPRR